MSEIPVEIPVLSSEMTECLKFDLASGIHEAETIAERYGFDGRPGLQAYLLANRWLHEDAKHLRAVLESDQNTAKRVQLKGLYGCEEAIPDLVGIVKDRTCHPKDRIDAYKELRQSGGLGVAGKEGVGSGTQFSLVINMPGHTEKITATVPKIAISAPDDAE
jgi:hypothetical protein